MSVFHTHIFLQFNPNILWIIILIVTMLFYFPLFRILEGFYLDYIFRGLLLIIRPICGVEQRGTECGFHLEGGRNP